MIVVGTNSEYVQQNKEYTKNNIVFLLVTGSLVNILSSNNPKIRVEPSINFENSKQPPIKNIKIKKVINLFLEKCSLLT